MPYFIRVLSPNSNAITVSALQAGLESAGLQARLSGDVDGGEWRYLSVSRPNGEELFLIERNDASNEGVGKAEIEDFLEEIADARPISAVNWLKAYLPRVRTIYAFQILGSVNNSSEWAIVGCVKALIWQVCGGIFQADYEGFSNEDGYHILWQFSDHVTGSWWMAVLGDDRWLTFEMDLGNKAHREAFMRGAVPKGISSTP